MFSGRAPRLLHSSDLHLSADDGYDNPLVPLLTVLSRAAELDADAVFLVGDTFDSNRQPDSLLQETARVIKDAGRRVVLLPGNHDPLTDDSVYRRGILDSLDNLSIIGLSSGSDSLLVLPELDLSVWGRPHLDYNDMRPLRDPAPRAARWHVAVAHGQFEPTPIPETERFRPSWLIYPDEIQATGADYVALGHWNRAVRVGEQEVPAYYSGSPDLAGTANLVQFNWEEPVAISRVDLSHEKAQLQASRPPVTAESLLHSVDREGTVRS